MRKTKIIATLGPATETEEIILKLIEAGVNWFRLNLKYNTKEWHQDKVNLIKKIALKNKIMIGIIVDIPSPKRAFEIKDVDMIALSYLKKAKEVENLKNEIEKRKLQIGVIAKIENEKALENLEEIIEIADGIMIARGDLGREIPLERLAFWQKKIITMTRDAGKSVIVATEMLKSMTVNSSPTRAEATDVANAVFNGTDAVMMSEETSMGNYPIKAAEYMNRICEFNENREIIAPPAREKNNLSEVIIDAAINTIKANHNLIDKIVVFSESGRSIGLLSSYRLEKSIIGISNNEIILNRVNLCFGVMPYFCKFEKKDFNIDDPVFEKLKKEKLLDKGEVVMVIHGNNWYGKGKTSDISLKVIE